MNRPLILLAVIGCSFGLALAQAPEPEDKYRSPPLINWDHERPYPTRPPVYFRAAGQESQERNERDIQVQALIYEFPEPNVYNEEYEAFVPIEANRFRRWARGGNFGPHYPVYRPPPPRPPKTYKV